MPRRRGPSSMPSTARSGPARPAAAGQHKSWSWEGTWSRHRAKRLIVITIGCRLCFRDPTWPLVSSTAALTSGFCSSSLTTREWPFLAAAISAFQLQAQRSGPQEHRRKWVLQVGGARRPRMHDQHLAACLPPTPQHPWPWLARLFVAAARRHSRSRSMPPSTMDLCRPGSTAQHWHQHQTVPCEPVSTLAPGPMPNPVILHSSAQPGGPCSRCELPCPAAS